MVFLTDGLDVDGDPTMTASRTKGSIIVFESKLIHEVTPVTSGTRYSLVKWVQGDKPFR